MTEPMYDQIRARIFGGHKQNPFLRLLKDHAGVRGPIQGTAEEFSQILYELTQGELNRKTGKVTYEIIPNGNKDVIKLSDGSRFRIIRAKGELVQSVVVVSPCLPSKDDLLHAHEMSLSRLIDTLKIKDAYTHVALEYRDEERKIAAEKAAEERRILRECTIESALATIEKARNGETIMVRGLQNIDGLVTCGFVPCLVDNPDNWIDAEDFPGMRYRHAKSGIELLMIAREKFRPIEELSKLEFNFLVLRSDGNPVVFGRMLQKFRYTKREGQPYSTREFHDDLIALVKYPEELKGRTEEDLGLLADEIEHVIDRRQELDKGILSYEAVFKRDTRAVIDHVLQNRTPEGEIRKALDYFEYTGIIDAQYKATLQQQIRAATSAKAAVKKGVDDLLYDKRVKEIVATVLKTIPKERLTSHTITLALAPYVNELGFGKLVKIRERILQLKELAYH